MDISNQSIPGTLSTAAINSTATAIEAVAAVVGKQIVIWGMFLTAPATAMTFKSGSTALTGPLGIAAGVPLNLQIPLGSPYGSYPYFMTAVGEAFNIACSPGVQVSGIVYYSTL
jgi:hypothetical protein